MKTLNALWLREEFGLVYTPPDWVSALYAYYIAGRAVCVNEEVTGAMFEAFDVAQQRVDRLLGVEPAADTGFGPMDGEQVQ